MYPDHYPSMPATTFATFGKTLPNSHVCLQWPFVSYPISCNTIFRAKTFPSSGFGDPLFCKCDLQVYIYEVLKQENLNPSFYHLCSPQLMDKCEDRCIL